MRRGYVLARPVSLLFGTAFVAMVFVASNPDGIFDGAFAALTALVVMAGLLIGWKAALVMGGAGQSQPAGGWLSLNGWHSGDVCRRMRR